MAVGGLPLLTLGGKKPTTAQTTKLAANSPQPVTKQQQKK